MSKVCILGDTHFGVRNDNLNFHHHFAEFYTWFFEYLDVNDIKIIFQLGDLFDRRKYVNFNTLALARGYFFDQLKQRNIKLVTLLGNHDIYWRESLMVNSPELLLKDYDNIEIINEPTVYKLEDSTVDIIPWICADNEEQVMSFIKKSKSDICFGHFEIASFAMYKGNESHVGLPMKTFKKYELVCSGHYHTRSSKHNITYVGTPYEMTWQDYADLKGIHIFDTETRALEFVKSPVSMFIKYTYDFESDSKPDYTQFEKKYVKIVVKNKSNLYHFDEFIKSVYRSGAYDVKIIEDISDYNSGEIDEDINLEDSMDVMTHYINSLEIDNKEDLNHFVRQLYTEAVNLDVV